MTDSDHTTNLKVCPSCGESYPATVEYFPRAASSKSGLYSYCKSCANAKNKARYQRNREKIRARVNAKRATQREETNRQSRQYYLANRQKINQKNALYRKKYHRKWHVYFAVYQARRLSLPVQFGDDDWHRAIAYFNGCCAYCGNPPGLFPNMALSIEHYVPLSDPDCPGTVPTNIVPACRSCNSSKQSRSASSWLVKKFGKRKAKEVAARIAAYFESVKPSP